MDSAKVFAQIDYERLEAFKQKGFFPNAVFDVGASNASWSNKISTLFPEASFHLFEPLADIESNYTRQLETALQKNPAWTLHKCVVGKESGVFNFYRSKGSSYGSTSLEVKNPDNYEMFELPRIALDNEIDASNLPEPDLIKADIQGGELDMLKGCEKYLPGVQLLLLETWLSRGYGEDTPLIHEIIDYLLPLGFYLFELGDCYRDVQNNLIAQDFFFVNQASELSKGYRF